jgi:salicylate synthetase
LSLSLQTATFVTKGNQEVCQIEGSLADVARDFVQQNSKHGGKVHGYVSFNYAAEIRKQSYSAGEWPLLTLVVPRNEIYIHPDYINVIAQDEFIMAELCDVLVTGISSFDCPRPNLKVDTAENGEEYKERVTQVLSDISAGQYTKAIASRAVELHYEIDMPATLFQGRLGNTPARSFCINHNGFQATGFSPELVCLLEDSKVTTEPLAGTRARVGTVEEIAKLREELISDPKEVLGHIMSVKAAIAELEGFCVPDSVIVEDLMSVRERGPAQHLGRISLTPFIFL